MPAPKRCVWRCWPPAPGSRNCGVPIPPPRRRWSRCTPSRRPTNAAARRPGPGHAGSRRKPPAIVEAHREHRLGKRLSKYRDQLFTFLDTPGVPPDNNHAERQIRPAVIMRKNQLCNRSERGADTQATLMSVYRTLKLRGRDPTKTIAEALKQLLTTGQLPPLPGEIVAGG